MARRRFRLDDQSGVLLIFTGLLTIVATLVTLLGVFSFITKVRMNALIRDVAEGDIAGGLKSSRKLIRDTDNEYATELIADVYYSAGKILDDEADEETGYYAKNLYERLTDINSSNPTGTLGLAAVEAYKLKRDAATLTPEDKVKELKNLSSKMRSVSGSSADAELFAAAIAVDLVLAEVETGEIEKLSPCSTRPDNIKQSTFVERMEKAGNKLEKLLSKNYSIAMDILEIPSTEALVAAYNAAGLANAHIGKFDAAAAYFRSALEYRFPWPAPAVNLCVVRAMGVFAGQYEDDKNRVNELLAEIDYDRKVITELFLYFINKWQAKNVGVVEVDWDLQRRAYFPLYVAQGMLFEKLGFPDKAYNSYSAAYNIDRNNLFVSIRRMDLAYQMLEAKKLSGHYGSVVNQLQISWRGLSEMGETIEALIEGKTGEFYTRLRFRLRINLAAAYSYLESSTALEHAQGYVSGAEQIDPDNPSTLRMRALIADLRAIDVLKGGGSSAVIRLTQLAIALYEEYLRKYEKDGKQDLRVRARIKYLRTKEFYDDVEDGEER